MKQVAIGILGIKLDRGHGEGRWRQWRPSVGLCQQPDRLFDRFELLHELPATALCEQVVADIALISPETEVRPHVIDLSKRAWDFERVYETLHEWAVNYPFDPENEEYYIHITTGTHVVQICLFLLVEAGYLPGKLIQTSPDTSRRHGSPEGVHQIIDLDLSKYDALVTRFSKETAHRASYLKSGIETRNAAFNELIDHIEQVAIHSDEPVLLQGPTGAGKSHLARNIYELRKQSTGLRGGFVEVNCATLSGDMAASALFGHTRGAFTGAQRDRPGLLKEADGGVLFLDEIGELGIDEQAKLLHAIETGTFLPVGSDRPVRSQFQLISGTNRDLRAATVNGSFREDLLARLQLWTFRLPPLAERREDIAPNLDYELEKFSRSKGRRVSFNKEAREAFLQFAEAPDAPWLSNFRDLNAAVIRMATLAPRGRIRLDEVTSEIRRLRESWQRPGQESYHGETLLQTLLGESLNRVDPFDRVQLAYVVDVCRRSHSASEAGRTLYAVSREKRSATNDADRLRKYLAKHGLDFAACGAL